MASGIPNIGGRIATLNVRVMSKTGPAAFERLHSAAAPRQQTYDCRHAAGLTTGGYGASPDGISQRIMRFFLPFRLLTVASHLSYETPSDIMPVS